jgi:hypothetical protein
MTGDAMQEPVSRVSDVTKLRRIALVTAQEARALDADLLPLADALHHAGVARTSSLGMPRWTGRNLTCCWCDPPGTIYRVSGNS